jgi:hypothetical protein
LPHLGPTGSSWVSPSITARYFSSCPSDPTTRWTPCPPKYYQQWLQVRLGCIQLSPSCPFRRLHTFCFLRPARYYPRFWTWRSSFERQRDFNPPEQRAAQRALPACRLQGRCPVVVNSSRCHGANVTMRTLTKPALQRRADRLSAVYSRVPTTTLGRSRRNSFRIPARVIARVAVAAFASGPTRRTA